MPTVPKRLKIVPLGGGKPRQAPERRRMTSPDDRRSAQHQPPAGVRWKSSTVLPTTPHTKQPEGERTTRHSEDKCDEAVSFTAAFGMLGTPMVCALVTCIAWTAWLIYVGLSPNDAANWLMGTSNYDSGGFWRIIDTNPRLTHAGVAGFLLVALGYLYVALKMLIWRDKVSRSDSISLRRLEAHIDMWLSSKSKSRSWISVAGAGYAYTRGSWGELTSFNGKQRKTWNALLKTADLAMQTVFLHQLLKLGGPVSITLGFAAFVAVNSLSSAFNIWTDRFSALTEVLIDSMMDLIAAVIYPIAMLVYCYFNFNFDRKVFETYLEVLPPGSFEHIARIFADPAEIALFCVSFNSLRIRSLLDFGLRISMNLAFCYRFKRVVEVLIWTNVHDQYFMGIMRRGSTTPEAPFVPQRPAPKWLAAVFVAFSSAVLLLSYKAIADSEAACSAYPQCVAYAYRWGTEACPCLIIIDIDPAPATYEQWLHPINAYETIKALASSGTLQQLQVINRDIPKFPDELRGCRNLKEIQLYYTTIETLPHWANEFKNLEILHIEGKSGWPNLLKLPGNLFSDMPWLSIVHFGVHDNLAHIPPLNGVPNLYSLVVAHVHKLRELPALDRVPNLHSLVIAAIPVMEQLPDMSSLQNLAQFAIYRPSRICCNGFRGVCDLTDMYCKAIPAVNVFDATCLMDDSTPSRPVEPFLGSVATQNVFEMFSATVCQHTPSDEFAYSNWPTKATSEMCDHRPFGECYMQDGTPGICYNTRMQVLACLVDDNFMELRRVQIQRGVGAACDPTIEKWLGCS